MTKLQKEKALFEAIRKSLQPYGVANELKCYSPLSSLVNGYLNCSYCPVKDECEKNVSVHTCSHYIVDKFLLNPNK